MPKRVPEAGVRVLAVDPKGLASRAGLRPGDRLLRVNGQGLRDLVDFHVQAGEEQLAIDVDRGGRPCSVVLERKWGRDLGLECEPPAPAEISTCANKCVFCFIHQLPPGSAEEPLRQGRRLPAVLPPRQLHHADRSPGERGPAHRRPAAVAPLHLRARDRSRAAALPPGEPEDDPRATSWSGCGGWPMPGSGSTRRSCCAPGLNDGAAPRAHGARAEPSCILAWQHGGGRPRRPDAAPRRAVPAPVDHAGRGSRDARRDPRRGRPAFSAPSARASSSRADELYLQARPPDPARRGLRGASRWSRTAIGLVRRFEDDLRRRGPPAGAASLARGARGHGGDR